MNPKGNQSWIFTGRTDAEAEGPILYLATWCEELTHWKRSWCWERLKVGGEGDDRGWDGWMASPTLWTWVWARWGSSWRTEKPGVLQSVGLQSVRHDWAIGLNWIWSGISLKRMNSFCFLSLGIQLPEEVQLPRDHHVIRGHWDTRHGREDFSDLSTWPLNPSWIQRPANITWKRTTQLS